MTPRIGITAVPRTIPTLHGPANGDTITAALRDAVAAAGGTPLVLPIVEPELARLQLEGLDGLVLAGGQDVDAGAWGADRHPTSTWVSPERDAHELCLARVARERALPVLGICRGLQLVNVALGGDVIGHVEGHDAHERHAEEPHLIDVESPSLLADALGGDAVEVNTLHHQAIGRLADGLRVSARSPDGLIEAAEAAGGGWLLGVQWHPELMESRRGGPELFGALVGAAQAARST